MEMYNNPLYKFDKKAGIQPQINIPQEIVRKFSGFGTFSNKKILKMLEKF